MNWSSILHTFLYLLAQHPDLVDDLAAIYHQLVIKGEPPAVHHNAMLAALDTARNETGKP